MCGFANSSLFEVEEYLVSSFTQEQLFIVRLYTLKLCFTVIMIVNVCVNYSTEQNWILNDEYFRIYYISVLSFTQEHWNFVPHFSFHLAYNPLNTYPCNNWFVLLTFIRLGALKVLSLKVWNYVVLVSSGESGLGNKELIKLTDMIRNVMQHAMVLTISQTEYQGEEIMLT